MSDRIWIVAHDFSPCADAAALLALTDLLDSKRHGRLVLLHVYTVLLPPSVVEEPSMGAAAQSLEAAARVDATRRLEAAAQRLREQEQRLGESDVTVEVLAVPGTPAEGLLAEAERMGADRIIVGTHGRTGVSHWLLGSVAERVVRRAKVPVLVAHAATKAA